MKMNELKVHEEHVLAAMRDCPEAKKVLEKLFPEVKKEGKEFDFSKLPHTILGDRLPLPSGFRNTSIQIRASGSYRNRAFWLDDSLNWNIVRDSEGQEVLIPTRK